MSFAHDVNGESTEAAAASATPLRRSLRLRQQRRRAAAAAVAAFVGTCSNRRSMVAPVVVAAADEATNDDTIVVEPCRHEPTEPAVRRSYRLRLRSTFNRSSMDGLATTAASTAEERKEPIGDAVAVRRRHRARGVVPVAERILVAADAGDSDSDRTCAGTSCRSHRLRRQISSPCQEPVVVVIPGEQAAVSAAAVESSQLSATGCVSVQAHAETLPVPGETASSPIGVNDDATAIHAEDDDRKLPAIAAMAPALAAGASVGANADDDGDDSDYDDLPQLEDVEPVAAGRKAPPGVFTADSSELGSCIPGWLSWSSSKVQPMIELPVPYGPEIVSRIPTREEIQAIMRSPQWREGVAEARRARLRRRPGTLYPGAPVPRQVRRGV